MVKVQQARHREHRKLRKKKRKEKLGKGQVGDRIHIYETGATKFRTIYCGSLLT